MTPVCFPFTDDTGKEMRDLMSQQTELLAAIAAGNASAEFIDASFGALLDGTNTTKVFWLWWPLSATGGASKYDRLCRFFAMMAKPGTNWPTRCASIWTRYLLTTRVRRWTIWRMAVPLHRL